MYFFHSRCYKILILEKNDYVKKIISWILIETLCCEFKVFSYCSFYCLNRLISAWSFFIFGILKFSFDNKIYDDWKKSSFLGFWFYEFFMETVWNGLKWARRVWPVWEPVYAEWLWILGFVAHRMTHCAFFSVYLLLQYNICLTFKCLMHMLLCTSDTSCLVTNR